MLPSQLIWNRLHAPVRNTYVMFFVGQHVCWYHYVDQYLHHLITAEVQLLRSQTHESIQSL